MVLEQIKLPGFLVEGAISIIGKSVKNRNEMDINEIKAIDEVKKYKGPVIFIHARDDELAPYHHYEDLNIYKHIIMSINFQFFKLKMYI